MGGRETSLRFVKGYGLLGLWGLFAVLIAFDGTRPDGSFLGHHSEDEWQYPLYGVSVALAFSLVELAIAWAILRPRSYSRSWKRALAASGVFLALSLGFSATIMHAPLFWVAYILWLYVVFLVSVVVLIASGVAALRSRKPVHWAA